jgi:transposase
MAFREVTVIEVKEVLRQWLAGVGKKRIAARVGLDPKTVRRYVRAAEACGLVLEGGVAGLTDESVAAVVAELSGAPSREHGEAWRACVAHRPFLEQTLGEGVRLSKARRLLLRQGVVVPYSTLHRFAAVELGFGRRAVTLPVVDGEPGEELQVDTGWMTLLEPDGSGRRRRFRAWIFTPSVSRYRFVWPCFRETTEEAIAACEAAWEFYGGVFGVLVPDNTKAIVTKADPLEPLLSQVFLEYAQARGFVIDPTRVQKAKDKARVERSVRDVRDDCFAGERLRDIEDARRRALVWCIDEYGARRHSSTGRLPREHFEVDEKAKLLPPPVAPYDVPLWAEPKVARDHFAQVAAALYSLPTRFIGRRLRARADSQLVRFYDGATLVKTHPRQRRGGKSIDPSDFPQDRRPYAMRDVQWLKDQACQHGKSVGLYAERLLDSPLPWTRMRAVRALLGLCRRYGDGAVETACARALAVDMISVHRLDRMLRNAQPATEERLATVVPIARYLRPQSAYALSRPKRNNPNKEGKP